MARRARRDGKCVDVLSCSAMQYRDPPACRNAVEDGSELVTLMNRLGLAVIVAGGLAACGLVKGSPTPGDAGAQDAGAQDASVNDESMSDDTEETLSQFGQTALGSTRLDDDAVSTSTGAPRAMTTETAASSIDSDGHRESSSARGPTGPVAAHGTSASDAIGPSVRSSGSATEVSVPTSSADSAGTGASSVPDCSDPNNVVGDAGNVCSCLTIADAEANLYMFCVTEVTHAVAREECEDAGGHLASIHSLAQHDWFVQVGGGLGRGEWWIGLSDASEEGTFVWDDGTPLDYTNWNTDEPNDLGGAVDCEECGEDCGEVAWQSWNDLQCSRLIGYICDI